MRCFLILIITLWTGLSYAAGVEVEMLNKLKLVEKLLLKLLYLQYLKL